MAKQLSYQVNGSWSGARNSVGKLAFAQWTSDVSVPADLDGPNVGTNPEELLLAAAASCYMITLVTLLTNRNLPYVRIDLASEGFVIHDGGLRFDRIEHRPTIAFDQAVDEDLVHRLAEHAEHACMVSSALRGNVEVTVHPDIAISTASH